MSHILFKPHTVPVQMPLHRAVYFVNGNDVDTVVVDGKILLRAREVTSVDEGATVEDAQREAELAPALSGLVDSKPSRPRRWEHSRH